MKRMWSLKQLKDIADAQAKAVKKDISTLVDAQGNERFIEGEIIIEEITGVTATYGRWSLSATHLMFVLALKIDDATTISDSTQLAKITLPEWILDKIIPLKTTWLDIKTFKSVKAGWSMVDFNVSLYKSDGKIIIQKSGNFTADTENVVRINFDLLIDNE